MKNDDEHKGAARWPHRQDILDMNDGLVYLTRWTLIKLFGWSIKLHCIRRPDVDRCTHDHPWAFWTFCLWGGYEELVLKKSIQKRGVWQGDYFEHSKVRPFGLYRRPAEYRHRITLLPKGSAWTLVVTSPVRRSWGFWIKGKWMHWRTFVDTEIGKRIAWCGTDEGTDGFRTPVPFTPPDDTLSIGSNE